MTYQKVPNLSVLCNLTIVISSLNICIHKDANEFGNHFRIFCARMVQNAESAWNVLDSGKRGR